MEIRGGGYSPWFVSTNATFDFHCTCYTDVICNTVVPGDMKLYWRVKINGKWKYIAAKTGKWKDDNGNEAIYVLPYHLAPNINHVGDDYEIEMS